MIITIGQGSAYVLSGMYGEVADLGFGNAFLLILQLFFSGILVLLLVSNTYPNRINCRIDFRSHL